MAFKYHYGVSANNSTSNIALSAILRGGVVADEYLIADLALNSGFTRSGDAKWVRDANGNLVRVDADTVAYDYSTGQRAALIEPLELTRISTQPVASVAGWVSGTSALSDYSEGGLTGLLVESTGAAWHRAGTPARPYESGKIYSEKFQYFEPLTGSSGRGRMEIYVASGAIIMSVFGSVGAFTSVGETGSVIHSVSNNVVGVVDGHTIYEIEVVWEITEPGGPWVGLVGLGPDSATTGEGIVVRYAQTVELPNASARAGSWMLDSPTTTYTRPADTLTGDHDAGTYDVFYDVGAGEVALTDVALGAGEVPAEIAGHIESLLQLSSG